MTHSFFFTYLILDRPWIRYVTLEIKPGIYWVSSNFNAEMVHWIWSGWYDVIKLSNIFDDGVVFLVDGTNRQQ